MIECAIAAVTPVLPSGRRKRMVNLEALWRKAAALLQQAGMRTPHLMRAALPHVLWGRPLCAPQAR